MPKSDRIATRSSSAREYTYRRTLGVREILPAIAVGIGAGLLGFYVARLLLQRTPLRVERHTRSKRTERSGEA